jgi:hypothetical protein
MHAGNYNAQFIDNSSSETSDLTRATQRNILEDGISHSHCRENLGSYIQCFVTKDNVLEYLLLISKFL